MLAKTSYTINPALFDKTYTQVMSLSQMPGGERRIVLNEPTGDFFYDPWKIKQEFKGTVWEEVLNTLPYEKGEARLMKLDQESCYSVHADIDDRWHLNLSGNNCFLVDLENNQLYPVEQDLTWWDMDAGRLHSAINFGTHVRYQLVVRKLLESGKFESPVNIKISPNNIRPEVCRFEFDQSYSRWLNYKSKEYKVSNFKFDGANAYFTTEKEFINELKVLAGSNFNVDYE